MDATLKDGTLMIDGTDEDNRIRVGVEWSDETSVLVVDVNRTDETYNVFEVDHIVINGAMEMIGSRSPSARLGR